MQLVINVGGMTLRSSMRQPRFCTKQLWQMWVDLLQRYLHFVDLLLIW